MDGQFPHNTNNQNNPNPFGVNNTQGNPQQNASIFGNTFPKPFQSSSAPFGNVFPQPGLQQTQFPPAFGTTPLFGNTQSTALGSNLTNQSPGFGTGQPNTTFNSNQACGFTSSQPNTGFGSTNQQSTFGTTTPFTQSTGYSQSSNFGSAPAQSSGFGSTPAQPSNFGSTPSQSPFGAFQNNSFGGNQNISSTPGVVQDNNQSSTQTPQSSLFSAPQQFSSTAFNGNTQQPPFGSAPNQLTGLTTTLPSTSTQFGDTKTGSAAETSAFSTQSFTKLGDTDFKNTTTIGQSKTADQSTLISSMKDNSINLYNLTLQEIIDRHSGLLEANIKAFEREAQAIFDIDLQLIKNKNSYILLKNKLDEENTRLDELNQALDYFEERLASIESGNVPESAKVVEDFENICEKFYRKIEAFKDEQGDVLDLVNENYHIIEAIDKKLDMLGQIKNIK